MGEFLKFLFVFTYSPKTYDEMLKKLTAFAFWETYVVSFFLRDIPAIGAGFQYVETYGSLGRAISKIPYSDSINITGLVIAIIVAMLSNYAHLHDRVSDLVSIRQRFDRDHILVPLAKLVGATLSEMQEKKIDEERHRLMRDQFYKYTSSTLDTPLVDKHYIRQALSAWTWFWVLMEAITILFIASMIAFSFGGDNLGGQLLGGVGVLLVLAFLQRKRVEKHTRVEIEIIAKNATARADVKSGFDAL